MNDNAFILLHVYLIFYFYFSPDGSFILFSLPVTASLLNFACCCNSAPFKWNKQSICDSHRLQFYAGLKKQQFCEAIRIISKLAVVLKMMLWLYVVTDIPFPLVDLVYQNRPCNIFDWRLNNSFTMISYYHSHWGHQLMVQWSPGTARTWYIDNDVVKASFKATSIV